LQGEGKRGRKDTEQQEQSRLLSGLTASRPIISKLAVSKFHEYKKQFVGELSWQNIKK
jgi:hypothetical protein